MKREGAGMSGTRSRSSSLFPREKAGVRVLLLCFCLLPLACCLSGHAQSLDDRLDEDQFLRGLVDYGLPEVLEHYLELHPPADPIDQARYDIALKHMRVRDERLIDAQRLHAIEDLLATRSALLASAKDDPRHALWLTDQAADLYFVLLPYDATGLTAVFGLPSDDQRARAQYVAREMYRLMSLAEIEIEQAILDLESQPGYADDVALQLQRRRLSSEQRERRIPFLLGCAAYLHARLNVNDVDEQRDLCTLAADSLTRVADLLDAPLSNQARIYAGLAYAFLGNVEAVDQQFDLVQRDVDATDVDRFMVGLGQVIAHTVQIGPHDAIAHLHELKQQYHTRETLFFRILVADCEHLLLRNMADSRNGQERGRLLAAALQPYIDLLDVDLGVPRDTLRQIVLTRLARAIDPEVPIDAMPALAAIAQADMFAHDEGTRDKAIELFEDLLARPDLTPADRAAALDGLGRALLADNQRELAAGHLLDLATTLASQPQAERAIELAASIAAELYRKSPESSESAALLRNCLDVLLARYTNLATIDQWRFLAGRVALLEERFADARVVFTSFAALSDHYADAQYMRVQTTRAEAARSSDPQRRQLLAQQLLAEAAEVETILRGDPPRLRGEHIQPTDHLLATLAVYRAEAHLETKQPEQAIAALEPLASASEIEPALIAEATRLRIRAYYESNQPENVVREIERLTQSAPEEGGPMLSMLLESTQRNIEGLLHAQRHAEGLAAAQRELVPLADALANWLKQHNVQGEDRLPYLLRIAEAHRVSERHSEALAIYNELAAAQPEGLEAILGKAECLYALGRATTNLDQLGEAMIIYRRIGAASEEEVGETWWLAQLRTLQILEATDRNTQQIVPRILQLRQRDQNLGGERFKHEFDALQNRMR